jgi:hypothetical protein
MDRFLLICPSGYFVALYLLAAKPDSPSFRDIAKPELA